jgi:hypothetical protein
VEFVKCTYLLENSENLLIILITLVSEVVSDEDWFEYNIAIPRLTVSADSFLIPCIRCVCVDRAVVPCKYKWSFFYEKQLTL